MKRGPMLLAGATLTALFLLSSPTFADPSKYPEFARQALPENVTPSFISVDQLVAEIRGGKKPLLIDVRSAEEYREAHILGALSAPLSELKAYIASIPKDRLVVFY